MPENIVSSDRMDGAALQNIRFWPKGKAFASALYRQTTEALGELYKTAARPLFSASSICILGRFISWAVECRSPSRGVLVGGVGVAGLPQGVDEKSAQAGIDAWMKFRATMKR